MARIIRERAAATRNEVAVSIFTRVADHILHAKAIGESKTMQGYFAPMSAADKNAIRPRD